MKESPELEIWEDDYVMSDCGPLGSQYFVSQIDETFSDWDSAIAAINSHMEEEQYWPNIWYQNDHGGIHAIATSGMPFP